MYFCPKSLCNERSYARHARYFAAGDSLRSDTPIINPVIYERAQEKLKTNKADKSHLPLNTEDFLLRGQIHCATCTHAMKPRTQQKGRLTKKGTDKSYPFYRCTNTQNRYDACPTLTTIRTAPLDDIVWQECCVLFKRIEVLQTALETEMKLAINALLEDTTGQQQIQQIEATIALARHEREKYDPGSDMHNLISQDITKQEALLAGHAKTIRFYQKNGTITKDKDEPFLLVHRDELLKLQRKGFLQRNTEEIVRDRVEISYSPRFIGRGNNLTAAPVSLQTRRYI